MTDGIPAQKMILTQKIDWSATPAASPPDAAGNKITPALPSPECISFLKGMLQRNPDKRPTAAAGKREKMEGRNFLISRAASVVGASAELLRE